MKRILLAGVGAIILHGMLFSIDMDANMNGGLVQPDQKAIRVSMIPVKTKRKPVEKKSIKPVLKKKVVKNVSKETPAPAKQVVSRSGRKASKKIQKEVFPVQNKQIQAVNEVKAAPQEEVKTIEINNDIEKTSKESFEIQAPPASALSQPVPQYRLNSHPKYPRLARKRGYQGTVILSVLVGLKGSVSDLKVHQSSGFSILDEAALKAVKRWKFTIGTMSGKQSEMWVKLPVKFELRNS